VNSGSYTLMVNPTSQMLYTYGDDDDELVESWSKNKVAKPKEGIQNSTATFTITVSPVNGYMGTVQLSASSTTSNNPPLPTISPASVTLNGLNSATATLTITDEQMDAEPGTYNYIVQGSDGSGKIVLPPTQPSVVAVLERPLLGLKDQINKIKTNKIR
jgi:hypothetical protein